MKITYKVGVINRVNYFDGDWKFEYVTQNTDGTDNASTFPNGTVDEVKTHYPEGTIFLDSALDDIYGYTTLQNVIINSEGPSVLEDKTTRQVLNVGGDKNPTPIKVEIKFKSKSPLDVMEIEAYIGNDPTAKQLIHIHRKERPIAANSINNAISKINLIKNNDTYTLSFLIDPFNTENNIWNSPDDLIDQLNAGEITIRVFDINANGVEYTTYGEPWKYITTKEQITDIQKLQITFSNVQPPDMMLGPNLEGSCTVCVFNPNTYLWSIKPTIVLADESIGEIDMSTYYDKDYEINGCITFKVNRIVQTGSVIVHAWIDITNPELHQFVYNNTYAEGVLGPWIMEDDRNRKIKLMPYPPAYMKDGEYYKFVKFTENFLNTMYMALSKPANIGILEKVARIADFNYIDAVEAKLLNHYHDHFGIEIDPNIDDMQRFLLQKKVALKVNTAEEGEDPKYEIVGEADAYEDLTDKELNNFIRYIYHEIPEYNQYKGSYKGVKMALNMLGLCCKLVELWSKVDDASVDDLIRSDEINDFPLRFDKTEKAAVAKLYLTSRFDVDIEEPSITFREFNDLADNICRLIFQTKPVTRLLRKLSYIYYFYTDLQFSYLWFPFYNLQQVHHYKYIFPLASDYVRPKHEFTSTYQGESDHEAIFLTFDKLYVNHIANEAYVTYTQQEENKEWIEGTGNGHPLITRTTNKNAYCNLRNLAYWSKLSQMKNLKFKINYCYYQMPVGASYVEGQQYEGGHDYVNDYIKDGKFTYDVVTSKKAYLDKYDSSEWHDEPTIAEPKFAFLPLFDFTTNIGGDPEKSNTVTIDEAKNGFYINFHGATNGFIPAQFLLPEFFIYPTETPFYHKLNGIDYQIILKDLELEIEFDIALGTHFIAQNEIKDEDYNFSVDDKGNTECKIHTGLDLLYDKEKWPPLAFLAKNSTRY